MDLAEYPGEPELAVLERIERYGQNPELVNPDVYEDREKFQNFLEETPAGYYVLEGRSENPIFIYIEDKRQNRFTNNRLVAIFVPVSEFGLELSPFVEDQEPNNDYYMILGHPRAIVNRAIFNRSVGSNIGCLIDYAVSVLADPNSIQQGNITVRYLEELTELRRG